MCRETNINPITSRMHYKCLTIWAYYPKGVNWKGKKGKQKKTKKTNGIVIWDIPRYTTTMLLIFLIKLTFTFKYCFMNEHIWTSLECKIYPDKTNFSHEIVEYNLSFNYQSLEFQKSLFNSIKLGGTDPI